MMSFSHSAGFLSGFHCGEAKSTLGIKLIIKEMNPGAVITEVQPTGHLGWPGSREKPPDEQNWLTLVASNSRSCKCSVALIIFDCSVVCSVHSSFFGKDPCGWKNNYEMDVPESKSAYHFTTSPGDFDRVLNQVGSPPPFEKSNGQYVF